jgi:tetratricopeptide (TPR) repeat protein
MTSYWQATVQDHFLIVALSALIIPFCLALLDWRNALIYLWALGLLWILLFSKKRGRRETPYFLVVLLLLVSALVVGLYHAPDRETSSAIQRVQTDSDIAKRLVAQYSMTGSGLGSYEKLYQRHDRQGTGQGLSPFSRSFVMRARTEIGWLSVAAAIWFFTTLIWRVWPDWRSRRNKLAIYFFAGSLSGLLFFIVAVALLELSIPVWLGYYAFVMAGLVTAASQSSYQPSAQDDYLPTSYDWRYFLGTIIATGVVMAALLFHGGGLLARELVGSSQVAAGQDGTRSFPEERLLVHAALSDPLEALYRRRLAWRLLQQGRTQQAMPYFSSALRLDPLAGLESYRLGMYMADAGHGNAAIKLMQHGLNNDWSNQVLQVDFVTRLLTNGEKTRALNHVRQILATDPSRTLEWLNFLNKKGLEVTEEAVVLAGHARCYIDYGEFVLEKDYPELSANSYAEALRILQGAEAFQPEIVWRLFAFFEARQEYEKALTAVLAGTRLYPEDLTMMKASGRLHERLGLTFKAAEIYRKILMHTPQDLELRRHLNQLVDQRH